MPQVRYQDDYRRQGEPPGRDEMKDRRVLPRRSGCIDPLEGGIARERQHPQAPHEEGVVPLLPKQLALVELGYVGEKFRSRFALPEDLVDDRLPQGAVREMLARVGLHHTPTRGRAAGAAATSYHAPKWAPGSLAGLVCN